MSRPEALRARDAWEERVWCSKLRPPERLVALAYADHARDGLGLVFVTVERLVERTGLSRSSVMRAMASLRQQGWLVPVEPARQHRAPRYALRFPVPGGAEHNAQGDQTDIPERSRADTPEPPGGVRESPSGATVTIRGPSGTPDLSSDLSPHHLAQAGDAAPSPLTPAGSDDGGMRVDPRQPNVACAALDAGVEAELIDRVVALALADTNTHSPAGRMSRDAGWRGRLVGQAHAQRQAGRRADATAAERTRLRRDVARHGQAGLRAVAEARYAQGCAADDESLSVLRQAIHDLAEAGKALVQAASATPAPARMQTTC